LARKVIQGPEISVKLSEKYALNNNNVCSRYFFSSISKIRRSKFKLKQIQKYHRTTHRPAAAGPAGWTSSTSAACRHACCRCLAAASQSYAAAAAKQVP
jgi:hypothetical protein